MPVKKWNVFTDMPPPVKVDAECACGHRRYTEHDGAGRCQECRCQMWSLKGR